MANINFEKECKDAKKWANYKTLIAAAKKSDVAYQVFLKVLTPRAYMVVEAAFDELTAQALVAQKEKAGGKKPNPKEAQRWLDFSKLIYRVRRYSKNLLLEEVKRQKEVDQTQKYIVGVYNSVLKDLSGCNPDFTRFARASKAMPLRADKIVKGGDAKESAQILDELRALIASLTSYPNQIVGHLYAIRKPNNQFNTKLLSLDNDRQKTLKATLDTKITETEGILLKRIDEYKDIFEAVFEKVNGTIAKSATLDSDAIPEEL